MADRDELKSRLSAFGELPLPSRLHMFSDSANRESQNVEDERHIRLLEPRYLTVVDVPSIGQTMLNGFQRMARLWKYRELPQALDDISFAVPKQANVSDPLPGPRFGFAEGGTVDDILSAYSAPVRSWPGEQALDDEARANYAAMHPEPKKLRPDEAYRGMFLPFRETTEGKHEWAMPGIFMDPADAAKAIHASSGTSLGAMARPSQLSPEALDEILGIGGAGALTGIMGNMPRVLAKPSAGMTELGIFGGRRGAENLAAKGETRPLQALDMLERLEKEGKSRDEIWAATNEILKDSPYAGAFRGKDTKPRFEIDDSGAHLTEWDKNKHGAANVAWPADARARSGVTKTPTAMTTEDFISHPAVERAYWPIREDSPSVFYDRLDGYRGMYHPKEDWVTMDVGTVQAPDKGLSTALHEYQHAIQQREGFAPGINKEYFKLPPEKMSGGQHQLLEFGDAEAIRSVMDTKSLSVEDAIKYIEKNYGKSPLDRAPEIAARHPLDKIQSMSERIRGRLENAQNPYEAYRRTAGEAEARLVQKRQDLTPDERRSRPPWLDYDIPESQQIVRFGDNGPQLSFGGNMPKGYRARGETDHIGRTNYDIERTGPLGGLFGSKRVGTAYVRDLGDNVQIGRIAIDPEHSRKGIGTALYGQIEKDLGKPLVPDSVLSDAAYQFWLKHRPEAVESYVQQLGNWIPQHLASPRHSME